MNKLRILLTFSCMLSLPQSLRAQFPAPEASRELMNLIRSEKFEVILPQVMRDNQIDMWIHMKRGEDPLNFELGDNPGVYIFTDRGGDRIERAVFGGSGDKELYDIFGAESDIAQFVSERAPKRIAMNYSEENSGFNTISEADRTQLLDALGENYSERVVPADHLIADFLAGRVMAEIALYGRLLMTSSEIIDGEREREREWGREGGRREREQKIA